MSKPSPFQRKASTALPLLLVVVIPLLNSSCATIIMGSKQKIEVNSEPAGAKVFVNGNDTQKTTPATVTVKRKSGTHVLKFERTGYEDTYHDLHSTINPLVFLDFFLGFFPALIDVGVGAHIVYDKTVYVKMAREKQTVPPVEVITSADASRQYSFKKLSDVDINIPRISNAYPNRYALVIGNEDYSSHQKELNSEVNVEFARDDASAFKEYAQSLLGIPERNITLLFDATAAEIRQGIAKLNLIAKNSGGNAELFVFYAGHGLPEEKSEEPYLMPVDVSGRFISLGIPVKELYQSLTEHPTKRVTVFLDACFSGGARSQGLLAARGVRLTPKNEMLKGNIVVFSASSGDESALPYKKKNHGLFTYYLLQKLQASSGDITYEDLSKYLEQHVALESVIVNSKEQHPKTSISPEVIETWGSWRFN